MQYIYKTKQNLVHWLVTSSFGVKKSWNCVIHMAMELIWHISMPVIYSSGGYNSPMDSHRWYLDIHNTKVVLGTINPYACWKSWHASSIELVSNHAPRANTICSAVKRIRVSRRLGIVQLEITTIYKPQTVQENGINYTYAMTRTHMW